MRLREIPYASKLKKSATMRPSDDVVDYFKAMASAAAALTPAARRRAAP